MEEKVSRIIERLLVDEMKEECIDYIRRGYQLYCAVSGNR